MKENLIYYEIYSFHMAVLSHACSIHFYQNMISLMLELSYTLLIVVIIIIISSNNHLHFVISLTITA